MVGWLLNDGNIWGLLAAAAARAVISVAGVYLAFIMIVKLKRIDWIVCQWDFNDCYNC